MPTFSNSFRSHRKPQFLIFLPILVGFLTWASGTFFEKTLMRNLPSLDYGTAPQILPVTEGARSD